VRAEQISLRDTFASALKAASSLALVGILHVPQYRPLRIEIGGADQQHSTFDPLSSDLLNERIVHVRLDQFGQGRVVSQRRAFEQINQPVSAVVMNAEAALRLLLAQPTDTEAVRRLLACIIKDGMRTARTRVTG
jgi:hypothetical protein